MGERVQSLPHGLKTRAAMGRTEDDGLAFKDGAAQIGGDLADDRRLVSRPQQIGLGHHHQPGL